MICYQINTQKHFGGGEIYTRFLSAALRRLGWQVSVFVHPRAAFWAKMGLEDVTFIPFRGKADFLSRLPDQPCLIISHAPGIGDIPDAVRGKHTIAAFAHMPLYERKNTDFAVFDRVFAVSGHVIDSLRAAGLTNFYPAPLYGVADLLPRGDTVNVKLRGGNPYEWDPRKVRDRLLGSLYPAYAALAGKPHFTRKPGLTLGIVSRLTTIKQFPLLFRHLAPVIRNYPQIHLEIFGSGGYASVRDLKHALLPIRGQARFWGHQDDVAAVYPQLDFLVTGLPEREALGLNVIEAQCCGTPVLAVNAPPFTETVLEGETGFFYNDPRADGGADFERLLQMLLAKKGKFPDPRKATAHLARFSFEAFTERLDDALKDTLDHVRAQAL